MQDATGEEPGLGELVYLAKLKTPTARTTSTSEKPAARGLFV